MDVLKAKPRRTPDKTVETNPGEVKPEAKPLGTPHDDAGEYQTGKHVPETLPRGKATGGASRRRHPAKRLIEAFAEAFRCLWRHEGFEFAGYMSFTAVVALFPFIIFVLALAGFIGTANNTQQLIDDLFGYFPPEVAGVLAPVIRGIMGHHRADLLTLGIVFSVWTASSGVEALRVLLNRGYRVQETRSLLRLRLQSIVFVVIGALVLATLSFGVILGPILDQLLATFKQGVLGWGVELSLRYGLAIAVSAAALVAVHIFLPNRIMQLREIWPGVLTTLGLLLLGAYGFSLYLENLPSYDLTYGSLGGVIVTLLFFYINALFFALGAELNSALLRSPPC